MPPKKNAPVPGPATPAQPTPLAQPIQMAQPSQLPPPPPEYSLQDYMSAWTLPAAIASRPDAHALHEYRRIGEWPVFPGLGGVNVLKQVAREDRKIGMNLGHSGGGGRQMGKVFPFDLIKYSKPVVCQWITKLPAVELALDLPLQPHSNTVVNPAFNLKLATSDEVVRYDATQLARLCHVDGEVEFNAFVEEYLLGTIGAMFAILAEHDINRTWDGMGRFVNVTQAHAAHGGAWQVYRMIGNDFILITLPPWTLSAEDLQAFVDVGNVAEKPAAQDRISKTLWAVVFDACKSAKNKTFAVTNYGAWCFGYFDKDMNTHISQPIPAPLAHLANTASVYADAPADGNVMTYMHPIPRNMQRQGVVGVFQPFDKRDPNVLEVLMFWAVEAVGL